MGREREAATRGDSSAALSVVMHFDLRRVPGVPSLWVAELYASDRTKEKILNSHHIAYDDVRDVLVCQPGLACWWDEHPERGWRALTEQAITGKTCLIVLYPVESPLGDEWALGSCYEA
ncbi:hypothetical protein [Nocardioides korecus]